MPYRIKTGDFEGPIELLLALIESRKLSVNEVSIGTVADDYFQYLEELRQNPNQRHHIAIASFIVVAATLMLIKSRSLLTNFAVTEEEEADIAELEDRLRTYKAIKVYSDTLAERLKGKTRLYAKEPEQISIPGFLPPPQSLDLSAMSTLIWRMIDALPQKDAVPEKTIKKIISLEEKIAELQNRIEHGAVRTFQDFVGGKAEKVDVVVGFLAMLELIKLGTIAVKQSHPFEMIHIDNESHIE